MKKKFLMGLVAGLFLVSIVGIVEATTIDFQPLSGSVAETGYDAVTELSQAVDGITFTLTGALFDSNSLADSGVFDFADLYNDFAYTNHPDTGFNLTLNGLAAAAQYDIRFYSSARFNDDFWFATDMTNIFTPVVGSGNAVSVTWDRQNDPTSNLQDSAMGTFMSSENGELSFNITGIVAASDGKGNPFVRLNGLDLTQSPVPEPTTMLLFGLGLLGLVGVSRKKQ